jgi:N-acetylneuraminate synthase/N,N'-diacetyllegionaminate synthase
LRPDSPYYGDLAREELKPEALMALRDQARIRGLLFAVSLFDHDDLDFYRALDPDLVKIASCDLNHFPLLDTAAALGKPIVLSTGAADVVDVDLALGHLADRGASGRALVLHCTSLYPCPDPQALLGLIPWLMNRYGPLVGFSDHTLGIDISLAAAALGAVLLEKHFTIDRNLPGGDNEMSILPDELAALIRGMDRIHLAMGTGPKTSAVEGREVQTAIRRSVVAARPIQAGRVIEPTDLAFKRPGDGLPPVEAARLTGRVALRTILENEPLSWNLVR